MSGMTKEIYEKQLAKNRIKVACSCGCVVSRGALPTHIKTDKHKQRLSIFPIKVNKAERVKVLKFIEEKQKKEKYEKQKAYQNIKVSCRCGCVVSRVNLPAHIKSDKHKQRSLTGEYKAPPKGQGRKPIFGPMPKPFVKVVLSDDVLRERKVARQKQFVQCGCGKFLRYNSMWNHTKKYHPELLTKKV